MEVAIEWAIALSFNAHDHAVCVDFDREFSDGGHAGGAFQAYCAAGGESEWVRDGFGGTACLAALVVVHLGIRCWNEKCYFPQNKDDDEQKKLFLFFFSDHSGECFKEGCFSLGKSGKDRNICLMQEFLCG